MPHAGVHASFSVLKKEGVPAAECLYGCCEGTRTAGGRPSLALSSCVTAVGMPTWGPQGPNSCLPGYPLAKKQIEACNRTC